MGRKSRNSSATSGAAAPTGSAASGAASRLPPWVSAAAGGCLVRIHAVPRASLTEVAGVHGDALKVRLAAPPVDGRANATLCEWLADALGVPRGAVAVVSGATSREKALRAAGVAPEAAAAALDFAGGVG